MLQKSFIPSKPFQDFKWKWASLQCTEGINDPVVLLGVLSRMRKLEPYGVKYSSEEFAREMVDLSNDVKDSVGVDLARRTGERNLIRNSGQYWRAVGLIKPGDRTGKIALTNFGRKVADHEISQSEFAAITVQTFRLPNTQIQSDAECRQWLSHELILYPLRLILQIVLGLNNFEQGYVTTEELTHIIIPLSGCKAELEDYINFILWYRSGEISLDEWPDCCPSANDMRIAREYLLFLANYGYLNLEENGFRDNEQYHLNEVIESEIMEIVTTARQDESVNDVLQELRAKDIVSDIERKRTQSMRTSRPNQAAFRRDVLNACQRCIITNVTMPEVLEAAHIKPKKYNGEDTVANGFALRVDIHTLFDNGHLRISEDGVVDLSSTARMDYGASIPPRIVIPDFTDRDFLRWRWENYNGI